MDGLDIIILAAAVFAAVGGYRLGFLGRAVSWLGLAVGFYLAVRLLPPVLRGFHQSSATTLLVVAVVILVGGAMVGQALGLLAGSQLHRALPIGPARMLDRVVGAAVGAAGVLAVLWLLIPSLAQVPGWPAQAVTGSAISRMVSRTLPPPPSALQLLRRLVGNGNPEVFSVLQPGRASGPPPADIPLTTAAAQRVLTSTVKVQGEACGEIIEGSGFAVGTDLVATNAHVVAGESHGNTSVLRPGDGKILPATVVMYDPNRDLALLAVPGLGETPLPVAAPQLGGVGAVFGHPGGQDQVAVSPSRISQQENAVGPDIYGSHDVKRAILVLAASLAHGDSGGPLVDTDGRVVGVAFAISATSSGTAYALNSSELQAALAEPRSAGTSTQRCLTSG
ncbi:MAG TPA: MarP family serine protease [Acidimicrobiales bacterium]|nr:MarP family serine protease [Acidimicrobiales bacterium]